MQELTLAIKLLRMVVSEVSWCSSPTAVLYCICRYNYLKTQYRRYNYFRTKCLCRYWCVILNTCLENLGFRNSDSFPASWKRVKCCFSLTVTLTRMVLLCPSDLFTSLSLIYPYLSPRLYAVLGEIFYPNTDCIHHTCIIYCCCHILHVDTHQ